MLDFRSSQVTRLAAAYRSGQISRRVFMERLIAVLGSSALAQHSLESSGWAQTPQSRQSPQESGPEPESRNDPALAGSFRVESAAILYPGEGATLLGYFSRPQHRESFSPLPGLLLIHESSGLNEHIRAVARRLAAAGYFVLAVDQLSRQGGAASFLSPDAAVAACGQIADEDVVRDLEAATSYLAGHRLVQPDRIGVLGFGWGGTRAFLYAAVNPTLQAAVVFYGGPPPEDSLAAIQSPVLGNYAGNDTPVTATVAATQAAMLRLGKSYDAKIYPAAEPSFFNDTGPHYNEGAAQDAWTRTLAFLKKHLAPESAHAPGIPKKTSRQVAFHP